MSRLRDDPAEPWASPWAGRLGGPVVDSQVHGNLVGFLAGANPDVTLNALVTAMDAVGVDAVILDELCDVDERGRSLPGHHAPNGAWRSDAVFSRHAVGLLPRRFAYVTRIDHRDPGLAAMFADARAAPGCVGVRLADGIDGGEWARPEFAEEVVPYLEAAQRWEVPVFVLAHGRTDVLAPLVRRFAGVTFVLDHIGIAFPRIATPDSVTTHGRADRWARLAPVLALAQHPNVAVKWCHVERWSFDGYPYDDAMPALRRLIDGYGAERIMWASDHTQTKRASCSRHPSSWAQSLHHVADSPTLSDEEKTWVLGRTAQTLLRWTPGHRATDDGGAA